MTDLLKELEAVAGLMSGFDRQRFTAELERWFRTHHAEIAEAVKDARRYRALKALTHKDWTVAKDASRGGVFQFTGDDLDAAIDAQHNSAPEDGE